MIATGRYKDAEITPLVRDLSSAICVVHVTSSSQLGGHGEDDPACPAGLAVRLHRGQLRPPRRASHCDAHAEREVGAYIVVKRRFAEMLFEKMRVPSLLMYKDAALTCFSRGRTMGMVVDIGEDLCRCCGVFDGFVDRDNVSYQRFAGARLRDLYVHRCLLPQLKGKEELLPRGCVGLRAGREE